MKTMHYLVSALVGVSIFCSTSCFSYKKTEVEPTPPSTTVVQPAAPSTSTESSSTTTTTSTDADGNTVEKRSTTVTNPGY